MKRIVIGIVLVVGMVFGVWGNGNREIEGSYKDAIGALDNIPTGVERQLHIKEEKNIEQTNYHISINSGMKYYLFYKINDDIYEIDMVNNILLYDSQEIRELFDGFDKSNNNKEFSLFTQTGVEGKYNNERTTIEFESTNYHLNSTHTISIPNYGLTEKNLSILLIYIDSEDITPRYICEYFSTQLAVESFNKEKEIIDKLAAYGSENKRKFMIMKEFFKDILLEAPEGTYPPHYIPPYDENFKIAFEEIARKFNVISDSEGVEDLDQIEDISILAIISYARYNFVKSINGIINYKLESTVIDGKEIQLPYLHINENKLSKIYGPISERNVYTATFLYLYYKLNKPILENIIRIILEKAKVNTKYNYYDYKQITSGEDIAKSAIKYLTWSTEYSTPDITNRVGFGSTQSKVFGEFADVTNHKGLIDEWLKDPVSTEEENGSNAAQILEKRKKNYLPSPAAQIDEEIYQYKDEAPNRRQELETNFVTSGINLSAKLKNGVNNPLLSKIDIWNSINIAWEPGRIERPITSASSIIGNVSAINDKHIYLEEKNSSNFFLLKSEDSVRNLHLKRSNVAQKLETGYEFMNTEKISSLLLIRGFSSNYQTYNIGLKKKPSASASFRYRLASLATDGKLTTSWKGKNFQGDSKPVWIIVDLKSLYNIGKVVILWDSLDYATKYRIQLSTDGKKWTDHIINSNGTGETVSYYLPDDSIQYPLYNRDTQGQYLRISCTEASSTGNYAIKEIEVYELGILEEKSISIVYSTDSDDDTNNWKNIEFKDITIDPKENSFVIFPDYQSKLPGNSLLDPYYSNYNRNTTYSYIIFDEPVECKQIKISEYTPNSFFNVSELMAFPENPIQYITDYANIMIENDMDLQKPLYNGKIKNLPVSLKALWYKINKATGERTERWSNHRSVLFNTNPSSGTLIYSTTTTNTNDADKFIHLSIDLKIPTPIKRIVMWEQNTARNEVGYYNKESHYFADSLVAFSSASRLFGTNLFSVYTKDIDQNIKSNLTTPFANDTRKIIGNPLPYSPFGIDSPRTFNYKMYQQTLARGSNTNGKTTSAALDNKYWAGYMSEIDLLQDINLKINPETYFYYNYDAYINAVPLEYKPYLPNLVLENPDKKITGFSSLYYPNKIAGVDSVGLFLGALSMSGIKGVYDFNNIDVGEKLDTYYKMSKADIGPGMMSDGTPDFYDSNGGILNYRIGRSDLEKMTILIPDVSELKPGDLLVNYDDYGDPHIGIVYKLLWQDTPPVYGADYWDYMDKVLVISIRRGFRNAVIGFWGNDKGQFAGFSADPERYQMRRLVHATGNLSNNFAVQRPWELVKNINKKKWNQYREQDAPFVDGPPAFGKNYYTGTGNTNVVQGILNKREFDWGSPTVEKDIAYYTMQEQLKRLYNEGLYYLATLPPSSYDNQSGHSLFKAGENNIKMDLWDWPAWRVISIGYNILRRYNVITEMIGDNANGYSLVLPNDNKWTVSGGDVTYLQVSNSSEEASKTMALTNISFPEEVAINEDSQILRYEAHFLTDSPISIILGYKDDNNFVEVEFIPQPAPAPKSEVEGEDTEAIVDDLNEDAKSYIRIWKTENGDREQIYEIERIIIAGEENKYKIYLQKKIIAPKAPRYWYISIEDVAEKKTLNEIEIKTQVEGKAGVLKMGKGTTKFTALYLGDYPIKRLPWINFHMAADINALGDASPNVAETGMGADIYAPEDGEFWITKNEFGGSNFIPKMNIDIENRYSKFLDKKLIYDAIKQNAYRNYLNGIEGAGLIGFLVTNPDSPRDGRIYMFNHMGSKKIGEVELQYSAEYTARKHIRYPDEIENRIKVKASQWIGKVGQRGHASSPHIHFEVYEHFDNIYDREGNTYTDIEIKEGFGWRRVDPRSCFEDGLFNDRGNLMHKEGFFESDRIENLFPQDGIDNGEKKITLTEFIDKIYRKWYFQLE